MKTVTFFRDHERRIKADAELPDEARVVFAGLELFEKRLRSRVRDRSQILDQLRVCHTESRVGESDGFARVVGRDADLEREFGRDDFGAGSLEKLQLLRRVRGVRDEFADKDFLVRVKRVNDQIEQLRDLGLEGVFFDSG